MEGYPPEPENAELPTPTVPADLEPPPSPAADLTAAPGAEDEAETELWVGRTHWKHFLGRLLVWLLGNVGFLALAAWITPHVEWLSASRSAMIVVGVLLLSGLEVGLRRVLLPILQRRYRLTTQRLFIERGIFSQTVDQTELIRVDDVRLHKTFLDRLVGLGTVAVISTDATDREVVMEGIEKPEEVAEFIRTQMRLMRRKSLFIENL